MQIFRNGEINERGFSTPTPGGKQWQYDIQNRTHYSAVPL